VKDDYLQTCLNGYCHQVNRRYFGVQLSERVMLAAGE